MTVYTLGIWTAKAGREADFVAAWTSMAERTAADFPGAAAVLLRDRERPDRFISCGPWESLAQVASWRDSPTFRDGVAAIREAIDSFEPHTLDLAATIGPS